VIVFHFWAWWLNSGGRPDWSVLFWAFLARRGLVWGVWWNFFWWAGNSSGITAGQVSSVPGAFYPDGEPHIMGLGSYEKLRGRMDATMRTFSYGAATIGALIGGIIIRFSEN